MAYPKIYIAPISTNLIDAAINVSNQDRRVVGLIASRRQIDYSGGYVGFNTKSWWEYVTNKTEFVFLCRDHGGPRQLTDSPNDDGIHSLQVDSKWLDIIHIDPWKIINKTDIETGAKITAEYIRRCHETHPVLEYEVGTEQAIFEYSPIELELLLELLSKELKDIFDNIKYACIQSGNGLDILKAKNTGKFSSTKSAEFIKVCKSFGLKSKEHNGDYLFDEQISERFSMGLDAMNFAPEFGRLESIFLWNIFKFKEEYLNLNEFFNLCVDWAPWQRWLGKVSVDKIDKEKFCYSFGHYVFNHPRMIQMKENINFDNSLVVKQFQDRINQLINLTE